MKQGINTDLRQRLSIRVLSVANSLLLETDFVPVASRTRISRSEMSTLRNGDITRLHLQERIHPTPPGPPLLRGGERVSPRHWSCGRWVTPVFPGRVCTWGLSGRAAVRYSE